MKRKASTRVPRKLFNASKPTEVALQAQRVYPRREILVPVDFSSSSIAALRRAAGLASEMHAHVTVLNVVATRAYYRGLEVPGWQLEQERNRCLQMEELVAHELPDVESDFIVVSGEPATEICRLAHSAQADLIVLGRHDASDAQAFFAPHHRVSRKVTGEASCEVLLVESAA